MGCEQGKELQVLKVVNTISSSSSPNLRKLADYLELSPRERIFNAPEVGKKGEAKAKRHDLFPIGTISIAIELIHQISLKIMATSSGNVSEFKLEIQVTLFGE